MKKYEDSSEWIFDTHKCCACEKPIKDSSSGVNMMLTQYQVPWLYPQAGNILYGEKNKGVAVLCDNCAFHPPVFIKFLLEYRGEDQRKIVYHPVSEFSEQPPAIQN
jgi:hypothetical protein